MNGLKAFGGLIVLVVVVSCLWSSAYIVPEGWQAIITQFGKPVGKSVTQAGLYFKIPFIQDARFVDKRILHWDGDPNQIPTKENKYLIVDTTARWRISDPLKFIQTVQNERGAIARLDDILDSATRDAISSHRLVEAVRNSNSIVSRLDERRKAQEKRQGEEDDSIVGEIQEEVVGEVENVGVGRERLTQLIIESADQKLKQFGIDLIDVQLRRVAFENSVQEKVYQRMISERMRIAEKLRSVGKGEQAKIKGKTARDLQKIESDAYRRAQIIKGKAEARAVKIYADAFSKDPQFYEFTRKMDAYKSAFKDDTELILSTDSEFLNMLKKQ